MENNNFIIIDKFIKKRENNIIENYQIILSDESIYLVNSSVNFGQYIKSIFSGVGEIIGLFGDTVGLIGGLASEITGSRFSKLLKEYSEKSSKKNMEKIINNLDTIAAKNKGITKIDYTNLDEIVVKKGYLVNGMSSVEFYQNDKILKLQSKQRMKVNKLITNIKQRNNQVKIRTKYL